MNENVLVIFSLLSDLLKILASLQLILRKIKIDFFFQISANLSFLFQIQNIFHPQKNLNFIKIFHLKGDKK